MLRRADRRRRGRAARRAAAEHDGGRRAAAVSDPAVGLQVRGRGSHAVGQELLGFYHSHPDHPARPSQYDLDHAFPFFWYVIVSIHQGQPEKMTVWRLADDRSQFREASLQVTRRYGEQDSDPYTAASVYRQAGRR